MKIRDTGSILVSFFSEGVFSFVETTLPREQATYSYLTYLLGTLPYVPVVMKDALEIQYSYLLQKS